MEIDRQTDTQTDGWMGRQADRQVDTQTGRPTETEIHADSHGNGRTDMQTHRHVDRWVEKGSQRWKWTGGRAGVQTGGEEVTERQRKSSLTLRAGSIHFLILSHLMILLFSQSPAFHNTHVWGASMFSDSCIFHVTSA